MADLPNNYNNAQHTFYMYFCLIKKFPTNIRTKVLESISPQKSTKLGILQLKVIVNVPKKFEDESCIFLAVIAEKSATFHLEI